MAFLLKWTIFCYFVKLTASDITGIRFNTTEPATKNGVIQLRFKQPNGMQETWLFVCFHGDPNTFGKREATVGCRQLGYRGGWPTSHVTQDRQSQYLYNVDCDGNEVNLEECRHDITNNCRESKVAGLRCYDLFDITIRGGIAPNIGRMEVKYDDTWSDVCYVSKQGETRQWTIYNAQVFCEELGYPGTMMSRRGGAGHGNRTSTVGGYKCREDLRDESLQDCLPDIPVTSAATSSQGSSCDYKHTGEDNYAVIACAAPGYIGCFKSMITPTMNHTMLQSANLNISACRSHCKRLNHTFAYMHNGDICFCEDTNTNVKTSDRDCGQECSGNEFESCGGQGTMTMSIYDVNSGICPNHWNKSDVFYYFGHILSSSDICGIGMEPDGASVLQCVPGKSLSQVIWNDTVPKCYIPGNNGHNEDGIGVIIQVIIITAVVLVIIVISCIGIIFYVYRKKRRMDRNKWEKVNKDETTDNMSLEGDEISCNISSEGFVVVSSKQIVQTPKSLVDIERGSDPLSPESSLYVEPNESDKDLFDKARDKFNEIKSFFILDNEKSSASNTNKSLGCTSSQEMSPMIQEENTNGKLRDNNKGNDNSKLQVESKRQRKSNGSSQKTSSSAEIKSKTNSEEVGNNKNGKNSEGRNKEKNKKDTAEKHRNKTTQIEDEIRHKRNDDKQRNKLDNQEIRSKKGSSIPVGKTATPATTISIENSADADEGKDSTKPESKEGPMDKMIGGIKELTQGLFQPTAMSETYVDETNIKENKNDRSNETNPDIKGQIKHSTTSDINKLPTRSNTDICVENSDTETTSPLSLLSKLKLRFSKSETEKAGDNNTSDPSNENLLKEEGSPSTKSEPKTAFQTSPSTEGTNGSKSKSRQKEKRKSTESVGNDKNSEKVTSPQSSPSSGGENGSKSKLSGNRSENTRKKEKNKSTESVGKNTTEVKRTSEDVERPSKNSEQITKSQSSPSSEGKKSSKSKLSFRNTRKEEKKKSAESVGNDTAEIKRTNEEVGRPSKNSGQITSPRSSTSSEGKNGSKSKLPENARKKERKKSTESVGKKTTDTKGDKSDTSKHNILKSEGSSSKSFKDENKEIQTPPNNFSSENNSKIYEPNEQDITSLEAGLNMLNC